MKKAFWIFSLLTLVGLFGLTTGLYNSKSFVNEFAFSDIKQSKQQHFGSLKAPELHGQPVETVNYVTGFNNLPSRPLKNPFKAFLAFVKALENFYFHNFSQYSFYSQNLLIRVKQTDLIFPFHYFW